MKNNVILLLLIAVAQASCSQVSSEKIMPEQPALKKEISFDSLTNSIHVFVALCDNKYQGIVPVSAKIGNGQDADNNLYWGWGYGVRTYFKKSNEWTFIESRKVDSVILERLVFKHKTKNYYLVADAYNGKYIKKCTVDFLNSSSGQSKDTIQLKNQIVGINGNAKLISFIGHNGLMDFQLPPLVGNMDKKKRDCIILACISKNYFNAYLKAANVNPLLLTSGLMGPEAYTLHDALSAYIDGKSNEIIREKAAAAYSKYTKCSFNAAKNLLVSGW